MARFAPRRPRMIAGAAAAAAAWGVTALGVLGLAVALSGPAAAQEQ